MRTLLLIWSLVIGHCLAGPFFFGQQGALTSASSQWTPASLSGLQLWYDMSTLSGSNGAPVGSLTDLSGNGRNASQGTLAKQPTLATAAQNGRNGLRGDGVDDNISVSLTVARPYTVVLVYRVASNTGRTLSGVSVGGADNWLLGSHNLGSRWYFATVAVGSAGGSTGTGYSLVALGSASASSYYSSGTLVASSAATGTWGSTLVLLGAGSSEYANATIFEVFVVNRELSSTERASVDAYVLNKWGI